MFGYRDAITREEYRNWKKQGIDAKKKDVRKELLPRNVEIAEVIADVLLRNQNGFAWQAPGLDLIINWLAICPYENFDSIRRKAGQICLALNMANKEKRKSKDEEEDLNG